MDRYRAVYYDLDSSMHEIASFTREQLEGAGLSPNGEIAAARRCCQTLIDAGAVNEYDRRKWNKHGRPILVEAD